MAPPDNGNAEYYNPQEMEQQINQMVVQAVEAAARGESVDQLLEVMLQMLPVAARESLRKKFSVALTRRKLRQPGGETDIPSRETLTRLRTIFMASARQALDRVVALLRKRPDLAASVQEAGKILAMSGVVVDRVNISEADLGNMKPLASPQATTTRGTDAGRGA